MPKLAKITPYRLAEPAPDQTCMGCNRPSWVAYCDVCAPPRAAAVPAPALWEGDGQVVAVTSSRIRDEMGRR